jgi:diguanylate cyclase (GGDEF)-like protein/PAS domain S-box-containing protein
VFALLRPHPAALTFLVAVGLIALRIAPPGGRTVIAAIAGTAAIVLLAEEIVRARRAGPGGRPTKRLHVERDLAFVNAVMQARLDASPLAILVVDADADLIKSFNQRFIAFFDPPPSFAKDASDVDMLAGFSAATIDPEATFARVQYLYAHPKEIAEDEICMNDGRVFERHSVELRAGADASVGRIWFFNDVTAMRAATRTAQQERNVVSAILDSLPGYFVQIDGTGRLVRWNESLRLLNGLSNDEIMGSDPFANVIDGDRPSLMVKVRETIVNGAAEIEFRINTLSGVRTIRWQGRRIMVDGNPQVLAVGIDVTGIRAAEALLRTSEERFRIIFESVTDGIVVQDLASGRYLDANPRACEMFGYTREAFLALDPYSLSQTPGAARAKLQAIKESSLVSANVFEWRFRANGGREFWAEVSSRVALFGDREVYLSTMRDVTERRQASADVSYRDRLLHALTLSTAELVKGASYATSMPRLLAAVGDELAVDRLQVAQRADESESRPYGVVVVYGWQRTGVTQIDLKQMSADGFRAGHRAEVDAWLAPVREGIPVTAQVADATGRVREMLLAGNTRSVLIMPIFVDGIYWGQLSVDDTHLVRAWTPVEIEAVKTFADVVGAMIARQRTEGSLKQSEEQFRTVTETVLDAIVMIGSDGRIRFWNPAAERIFGYTEAEAQGQRVDLLLATERNRGLAADRLASFFAPDRALLHDQTIELAALRKDGAEIAVELAINLMVVGTDRYAVGVARDITERKRSIGLIEEMAGHDALTGLPNRRSFIAALDGEIARARRAGNTFAVLYLDLDRFKDVNDTLGHPVGDRLLQAVGQRLKGSVREIDTVARFGGDEFAAIQSDVREPASAAVLAKKIVRALDEPFVIDGRDIHTAASLGIAVYGPESPDAEALLAHADIALYLAKAAGRGTYRLYTDAMDADVRARAALENDLRAGLALHQFFLVYQPQVEASGRIVGVEATVRWQHPEYGILEPARFMAAAEKSGLIIPLGMWMLGEACAQTEAWLGTGIAPPCVAISVSAQQFKAPLDLEASIASIVIESGVPLAMLELELTESALTQAAREHNGTFMRLLNLGLRIAIDDFGNGYSSLDVLRRFPIRRIKIPRNFIANLSPTSENAPLVRGALGIARELGITAIAEGVEDEAQAMLLMRWGCEEMQGDYFAKPLAASAIEDLLRAGTTRPVPPAPPSDKRRTFIYADESELASTRTGAKRS